jgi:hypothetical protein
MVRDDSVHEDHWHPRLFGGDYERAAFLPKALDLAFGSLLDIGLIWHPEDNTNSAAAPQSRAPFMVAGGHRRQPPVVRPAASQVRDQAATFPLGGVKNFHRHSNLILRLSPIGPQ